MADNSRMTFFLKLRHWELCLLLALPSIMILMFDIPLEPLVVAAIGLFLMQVLSGWMFSIGAWSNRQFPESRQLKSLQENADVDFMIFSSTFSMLFISPLGIWLIQPSVNQLCARLEQAQADASEN